MTLSARTGRRDLLRAVAGLPLLALGGLILPAPSTAAQAEDGVIGPLAKTVLLGSDSSQAWYGVLSNYIYSLTCESKAGLGKFFYAVTASRKISRAGVEVVLGRETGTDGAGAGLIFNVSDDGAQYLGILLHPGGIVKLWQRDANGMKELGQLDLGPVDLSARPQGPVTLEVRATATGGDLVIEDTVVGSFEGTALTTGGAGIIAISPGRFGYRNFILEG